MIDLIRFTCVKCGTVFHRRYISRCPTCRSRRLIFGLQDRLPLRPVTK